MEVLQVLPHRHGSSKLFSPTVLEKLFKMLPFNFRTLWTPMVTWTEALASGTDYLRVDFFVNPAGQQSIENCTVVVSEMNVFPWPHSTFFQGTLELQRKAYLKGVSENS